ncbi:uncharacterized protein TERG_08115 [Trichophyton rubrum CBS 118892]|uniref:Uncharacterized protein n=1 Tax=Trichophyton rubrum (strain ATCC MYA-4607 / CBS 118892) TaxID=559305 RepID=F2SZX6_TRIRC|nr:uncharacterized protein TERG_08115 [Trichophyton rubrum CBS 118892]EGD91898.2 hypothetical protein TERG_08115 [Trichophyton rubrum CBS 118892]
MAATHPSNELTSQLLTNNIFKDQQRRRRLTVSKRQKMRQSTCRKTNRLLPCSERQKGPGGVPDIQSSRGRHQRLLVRQRAERKTNEVMKNACPAPSVDDRSRSANIHSQFRGRQTGDPDEACSVARSLAHPGKGDFPGQPSLSVPCNSLLSLAGPHAQRPKIRKAEPVPVPESPDSVRNSRHLPELLLLLVHLETRALPKGTGFRSFEVK